MLPSHAFCNPRSPPSEWSNLNLRWLKRGACYAFWLSFVKPMESIELYPFSKLFYIKLEFDGKKTTFLFPLLHE